MYLGGAGGTGKSRVIHALKDFFECAGMTRRFRLAAFTGAAAHNVGGMTLHSALNLGIVGKKKASMSPQARRSIIEAWNGVDFLFVDEVSLVSCALMAEISRALAIAKENSLPFGGINVIFAGDFCQLKPPGGTALYARRTSKQKARETQNNTAQDIAAGRLLWLGFDTAVILVEQMRQSGAANDRFRELLNRLRVGRCTNADFELLNSRIMNTSVVDVRAWKNAPVITTHNAIKDALNDRAARRFAEENNVELKIYTAKDKTSHKLIPAGALRDLILNTDTGQTGGLMGRLPLAKGMPVILLHNYDVAHGIVNGADGFLDTVLEHEEDGELIADACVISAPETTAAPLSLLPPKKIVALSESKSLEKFRHPVSGKKKSISRRQIPIVPAFAMTDYKAQGRTLEKVIIDLDSCGSLQSAYVMVSRAKSLEGLLILRAFPMSKIRGRLNQDLRIETRRLEKLCTTSMGQIFQRHSSGDREPDGDSDSDSNVSYFDEENVAEDEPVDWDDIAGTDIVGDIMDTDTEDNQDAREHGDDEIRMGQRAIRSYPQRPRENENFRLQEAAIGQQSSIPLASTSKRKRDTAAGPTPPNKRPKPSAT